MIGDGYHDPDNKGRIEYYGTDCRRLKDQFTSHDSLRRLLQLLLLGLVP